MQKSLRIQMKKCVISAVAGFVISCVLVLAFSWLIFGGVIPYDNGGVYTFLSLFAGSVCSGRISCAGDRERRMKSAAISGLVLMLIVICLGLILSCESIFSVNMLINTLTVFAGTQLGAIFCVKSTKRKRVAKAKLYHR